MSKWDQYQNFSTLAKKFGGPVNLLLTIVSGSSIIVTTLAVPITKFFLEKKMKNNARLSSLKNYKCGETIIKEGDIITIGSIDNDTALIKINDSEDPYCVSYSELLKITKKKESN